jgi:hypothetical protein
MTVIAPGDSPPVGGDQNGFMSWLNNLPAATQAAIMRTMNFANPISPAAADTLTQAQNPLNNPSPVPAALSGGGPQMLDSLVGHGDGPPPPPPPVISAPLVGGGGGGGSSGGGGNSQTVQMGPEGPAASPVNIPIGGGPGNIMQAPTGTAAPVRPVRVARVHPAVAARTAALPPGAVAGGYYSPTTGNARGSTWSPYTDPNDPRIFRGGPLARPV